MHCEAPPLYFPLSFVRTCLYKLDQNQIQPATLKLFTEMLRLTNPRTTPLNLAKHHGHIIWDRMK